jgi:hypothetical protein
MQRSECLLPVYLPDELAFTVRSRRCACAPSTERQAARGRLPSILTPRRTAIASRAAVLMFATVPTFQRLVSGVHAAARRGVAPRHVDDVPGHCD